MLSADDVLDYIKNHLGVPHNTMEMTDSEVIAYLERHALGEFSKYEPEKNKTVAIDVTNLDVKTDYPNRYKILDPDGRKIISVSHVMIGVGILYAHGYPYSAGLTTPTDAMDDLLHMTNAMMAYQHSSWYLTWKFHHPNIIELFPRDNGEYLFTVRYERAHDWTTIPNQWEYEVKELCLAHIELLLAARRNKYSSMSSPFGDIQLNADQLKSDGTARRNEIIQKLEKQPPNVLIRIG